MRQTLAALGILATVSLTAAPPAGAAVQGGPGDEDGTGIRECPQLSQQLPWYGDNRERLQQVIDTYGRCGEDRRDGRDEPSDAHHGHRPTGRPVAAFDWDNTVTKNDITDTTLAWALEHDKILQPRAWRDTSKWLTPAAHEALTRACGTDTPVGHPLPTSTNTACADEILEIRQNAKTMAGEPAFAGAWNHRRTKPNYAWVPQLFAGHTLAEVTRYTALARREALAAPVGAEKTVGTHTIHAYVRYYEQQRDLIATLQRAGFDVYIVSAGWEPVTEVWSAGVGVDAEHTLAIRSVLDDEGRVTTRMAGCGGVPDGQGEVIPYIDGKRCLLNEKVFGITGPAAWEKQDPAHRIVLGSGDADTDVTFVADAVGAHLVLNRNQNEIMCRAYDDEDGRWLVNPMFIEPLGRKETPYPCATAAYIEPDGSLGPVRRSDGSIVPDQEDRVHG